MKFFFLTLVQQAIVRADRVRVVVSDAPVLVPCCLRPLRCRLLLSLPETRSNNTSDALVGHLDICSIVLRSAQADHPW